MTVYDAAKSRRTIRKFLHYPIPQDKLIKLINCARLAPYGANLQPLKFAMITDVDDRKKLFPLIKYAGYLDWNPTFEQTPPAFIAILNDTDIKPTEKTECDSGAAGMSICLCAQEIGLGSVWLGAIDREGIKKTLGLDNKYDVTYLIGVGFSDQEGDTFDMNGSIKYNFDADENVHVPKRTLDEVIVKL